MATSVNMHEAKSTLSALVKRAERGEDILIARNGVPVVRITRLEKSKSKLPWGALHGKMADDFDAPLESMKDSDPFDRILIAQARAEGLRIITPDEQFSRCGVEVVW